MVFDPCFLNSQLGSFLNSQLGSLLKNDAHPGALGVYLFVSPSLLRESDSKIAAT